MSGLSTIFKMAVKAAAAPNKKLLDMKYTRETPKTKEGFSSVDLASEGKITDQEAIGGLFNPISFNKGGMKVGPDASNLNTSRIEISTFNPTSTPGPLGFGMKAADDIGLPSTAVGNKTKDAIKVQTNLIEGSKWKWEGKVPKGFENNTHLVSMQGGSKLKKASGGPTDHSYATKVIYEKGGNLSTYDTRAKYVKELHKSIPESLAALKIKIPKEVEKLTKELKAKGKSTEEIKKRVNVLKKKLTRDYKGDNPKGKPTTVGVPEFGTKIGEIKKGGIIQPVYDQIIMKEEGGQIMPMQYGGGLSNAYSTLSERRQNQNMYGMGDAPMQQMPSQMSSAFQDPMEASAFSPVNMEHGGDIVVPKERMINDQPHELSYINPQEAGLLKALGGSGRRVDGIPAYDTDDEGFYSDFYGDDGTTDSGDMGDGNAGQTGSSSAPSEEDDYSTYETYGILGDTRNQDIDPVYDPDNPDKYVSEGYSQQLGLTASEIMDNYNEQGGFSRDMGPLLDLYTPEQLSRAFAVPGAVANIRDAFMNNNFVGGGLPSTLQDAINKGQNIQFGPAFLGAQNRARSEEELDMITEDEFGEKKGMISSAIDTVKDFIMGGKELSPENQAQLNADLSKFGASFTPTNAFAQTITSLAIPMAATLGAKALGTPQTLGFIENRDGLTFEVTKDSKGKIGTEVTSGPGSSGGLDQIDSNDSGNDQVKNKVIPQAPVDKPVVVEEDEESPMSKLLTQRINNASKIDPNVKIIMDVYGISQEKAQEFLGKKGI